MPVKLLEVRDLSVSFESEGVSRNVVNSLYFSIDAGETLGIIGESGSGKSVSCMSILKLLGPYAKYKTGQILWTEPEQKQQWIC